MRIWASNLRSLVWKLHAQLSKLHSTCTKEQFEKKVMLGKKFTVSITSDLYSIYVWSFCRKKFGTVVKTAFHVRSWSFQERTNLSNKTEVLNFFGNSSVKFTAFGESFKHGCQNCILQVQRKNSRKNGCWRKKFYCFYHLWILIKVFKSFCEKLSARWSKLSFTSTDDASGKEEEISLITHILFWEFESQFYGVWCKLHARLSKLPSTRTKEQFEKNLKSGKKFTVLSLLNFIQKRFGVVAKKFRHGGLNCISRQRLIIPRKNKTLE